MYKVTYIAHHGTKDQKWGIRRYQNQDGSLTEAGKKRYAKMKSDNDLKTKKNRIDIPDDKDGDNVKAFQKNLPEKWVRDDISSAKDIAETGKSITKDVRNAINEIPSKQPKRMDLSKMTEKDMRDKINRELVERQYNTLFAEQKSKKGREYLDKTLAVSGSVLGIAASSLAIALSIRKIKNGE